MYGILTELTWLQSQFGFRVYKEPYTLNPKPYETPTISQMKVCMLWARSAIAQLGQVIGASASGPNLISIWGYYTQDRVNLCPLFT